MVDEAGSPGFEPSTMTTMYGWCDNRRSPGHVEDPRWNLGSDPEPGIWTGPKQIHRFTSGSSVGWLTFSLNIVGRYVMLPLHQQMGVLCCSKLSYMMYATELVCYDWASSKDQGCIWGKQGCWWALVQQEWSKAWQSGWRQEMYWASKLWVRIQWGLPGDKRLKLRSPGSKGQVLYTCKQQGETGTIGNYDPSNRRGNNGYKDNSERGTRGAIQYCTGPRDGLQCNGEHQVWNKR